MGLLVRFLMLRRPQRTDRHEWLLGIKVPSGHINAVRARRHRDGHDAFLK